MPSSSLANDTNLWSVVDPDIAHENPVEDKHRRLVRSHRSSPYDRELKPNAKIRDELGVSSMIHTCVYQRVTRSPLLFFLLGYIKLFPESTLDIRREGYDLEIQILPCEGEERPNQIFEVGRMARFVRSKASCGRITSYVDRN